MTTKTIKILGVQFAANPDYKFGDPETEEMWMRTINLLTELRDRKPRVVLKAEPTNPHDEKAVMARAMGQKIGYVNRFQRDDVRRLLRLSKRGMLGAEVGDVVVDNHGFLYITLQCEEAATTDLQESGFNWQGWHTDIPLVLPTEELNAEEEAAFVLEEDLLPRLNEVDINELQEYLNIWMENSRHDMSQEACWQRQQYIRQLAESDRGEVRMMAQELEHQGACMCNRHRMEERVMEWWPRLVDSDEADNMWIRWRQQTNGQLWEGLRLIDEKLRLLPGNLYESIGQMETVFSQLYYLNIPRETLNSILALLVLREKTCHELGIEMRPMTEADYANGESDGDSISMNDFSESFQKLPTNTAWSLYSGMFTLLGWNPKWLKNSPMFHQQILAQQKEQHDRQERKQDQIIDSMEKVANKPTTQNIYGDKNEFKEDAKLLKLTLPADADPAEIAMRIAEQQKQIENK